MHPVETSSLGDVPQRPVLAGPVSPVAPTVAQQPSASPATPSPASKLLGIWRLGESLHTGTRWQLWAAQPADSLGSPRWDYALQTISRRGGSAGDHQQDLTHLRRLAEVAAVVQHPHLIAVVDAALQRSEPFVVMPRLNGRPLTDLLGGAAQPLPVALWLTRQVASAAAALHGVGFVHGAIDPAGVRVSDQGHATLVDLGSACRLGQKIDARPPSDAAYAAPELLQSGAVADAASDVFSLGRLLWQLLALVDRGQSGAAQLEPVADLITELVDPDPAARPTAARLVERLTALETATLGQHIRPAAAAAQRRAA